MSSLKARSKRIFKHFFFNLQFLKILTNILNCFQVCCNSSTKMALSIEINQSCLILNSKINKINKEGKFQSFPTDINRALRS